MKGFVEVVTCISFWAKGDGFDLGVDALAKVEVEGGS